MTLQDLLALGFQQTPEGKMFLPYALTDQGRINPTLFRPGGSEGTDVWPDAYYGEAPPGAEDIGGWRTYPTFEEAFRTIDPSRLMASFGNDQNAYSFRNAEAANINGTWGHQFAPGDLLYGSSHKGTGTGWNDFRDDFVKPVATMIAGQALFGGAGSDTGGGVTDYGAGESGIYGSMDAAYTGGSSGSETLYGGAGNDTLAGGSTDNYFEDYIGYEGDEGYFGDFGQAGNTTLPVDSPYTDATSSIDWEALAKKYGPTVVKQLMGGGAGDGSGKTLGQSILGQFGSDPLGSAFSATPFLLALSEANRQGGDINQTIGRLRELEGSVAGNASSYMNAVLDPFDKETVTGRAALLQDQGLRGVRGSSFGDQSLSSYDYTRGLGRGDIASKALLGSTALQGNLIGSELDAITKRNTNRNLLLGAGLSASGRLFQPEKDPFNLSTLLGL